jgi:hypothetical protein
MRIFTNPYPKTVGNIKKTSSGSHMTYASLLPHGKKSNKGAETVDFDPKEAMMAIAAGQG